MAVKFLDLTGLQKLWKKIQTNFVAKDANGKVSVKQLDVKESAHFENDIEVEGSVTAKSGDITSSGAVNIKSGNSLTLYNDNNTEQVDITCNESGTAIINGHTDVKGSITAEEGANFGGGVSIEYGEGIAFFNDDNSKSASVCASSDSTKLLFNSKAPVPFKP